MFKLHSCIILALSLMILSAPISAQQVVGSASVKGRTIEVLDNQTWRYKSNESQDLSACDTLKLGVSFCNINKWNVTTPTGAASHMYGIDDRTYLMFIIEGLGSKDGITKGTIAEIAIDFAAEGSNTTAESVVQHFSRNSIVNSNELLSIAYSVKMSNMDFTFLNNIYVGEQVTVQAVLYVVGSKVSEKQIALNETLVKNLILPD